MAFGIERLIRFGNEWRHADAARDAAAGVLEMRDLLGELRLVGMDGGGMQRENMVEDAHQHLQPFGFAAVELLDFEPERGLLAVVHFLHELGELADFLRHPAGDFLCAGGNFLGLRLDVRPFAGGGVDLGGEAFKVLNFTRDLAEGVDIHEPENGPIIKNERRDPEQRANRGGGKARDGFPLGNRVRRLPDDIKREPQQQRVAEQKWPLRNFPICCSAHGASFGETRRERKQTPRFLLD